MSQRFKQDPNQISKSFCSLPWNQIHVSPIGIVKPCCIFDGPLRGRENKALKITDDTLDNLWNGDEFKKLRTDMLEGKEIPECIKCQEEERVSSTSDRIRSFELSDDLLRKINDSKISGGSLNSLPHILNLKIGNTCNLKCRMCQPLDSCAVDAEFSKIAKTQPLFRNFDNASAFDYYYSDESIAKAASWITAPLAQTNLESLLESTSHISLAGGEVTFTTEAMNFLRYCEKNHAPSSIELNISTNITKINDEFLSLLQKFKKVTVVASIDGIGKVNDYIRFPSKWELIEKNFLKLIHAPENIVPVIAPTVQVYNVLSVVEILAFIEKNKNPKWENHPPVHLTVLFTPHFLSIRNLPASIKNVAIKKLELFYAESYYIFKNPHFRDQVNLLLATLREESDESSTSNHREYLAHFLQYTELLDRERHQQMKDFLPELSELLDQESLTPSFPRSNERSFTYYSLRDKGFKFLQNKEFQAAIKSFQEAYALNQDDPDLLFSMGLCYKELKHSEKAKFFLKECLHHNSQHIYAQEELSRI